MTAPARITQADIERALKSMKAAGFEHFRLIMHLERREIEIIVGNDTRARDSHELARDPSKDEWDDE